MLKPSVRGTPKDGRVVFTFGASTAELDFLTTDRTFAVSVTIDGVRYDGPDARHWIEWAGWLIGGGRSTGYHLYSAQYLGDKTDEDCLPEGARLFTAAALA